MLTNLWRQPASATAAGSADKLTGRVEAAGNLILELDRPFDGLIQISSTPLRTALENLGQ